MKKKLVGIGLLIILLFGCSKKTYEPREINAQTDICKVCNMSIVDEPYAAQLIFTNGDYEVFDDIGCLIEFIKDKDESEIGAKFVKGLDNDQWINAESAHYVYSKDFWTPMNYGVLTFSTEEEAKNYIEKEGKGKLLTYSDLKTFEWGVHHE